MPCRINSLRACGEIMRIACGRNRAETAQDDKQAQNIHQYHDQQGKDHAVLKHVRLFAGNDPHRPVKVESPPEAESGAKPGAVGFKGENKVRRPAKQHPAQHPKRHEVGRQSDEDIVRISFHIPPFKIDAE